MNTPRTYKNGASPTTRDMSQVKSRVQQRREKLQIYTRHMIPPGQYLLYRFHERDKDYRYMLNFLSTNAQKQQMQAVLNDQSWKVVLDNKWLFYLHYRQFDLALPEVYGIYEPGTGFRRTGEALADAQDLRTFLQEVKPSALVAKPLGGIMGKEVLILNELQYADTTINATTNTGQQLTFDELSELLNRRPNVRYYMNGGYKLDLAGYLLQEKIEQHSFLNELAPYTTNTIRVVTLLDRNNKVNILFTILRLGRRGNMADNWDRGGVSVAIDQATGTLGSGVLKPKYGGQWLEVHPDSQQRFTGQTLPFWSEVIELCTKAARFSPHVRSIGWDVALTPQGPVLIEGNPDWDLAMVQVHTHGLLQPDVRQKLAEFGLQFPEGELPPFSVRQWWSRLREQYRDFAFLSPGVIAPIRALVGSYLRDFKQWL